VGESQSGFFDVSQLDRRVVKKVWRSTLLMKRRRRIAPSSLSHQEQGITMELIWPTREFWERIWKERDEEVELLAFITAVFSWHI